MPPTLDGKQVHWHKSQQAAGEVPASPEPSSIRTMMGQTESPTPSSLGIGAPIGRRASVKTSFINLSMAKQQQYDGDAPHCVTICHEPAPRQGD